MNFASAEAQNRTNRRARGARPPRLNISVDMRRREIHAGHAAFVEYLAACGRRIGMCGYTAVPEDGRRPTCQELNSIVMKIVNVGSAELVDSKCET